jgi:hypothetical protein
MEINRYLIVLKDEAWETGLSVVVEDWHNIHRGAILPSIGGGMILILGGAIGYVGLGLHPAFRGCRFKSK